MQPLEFHTDQDLIARLSGGDHAAYTEIYNRYNGPLYIFAYKRLRDREEAKDVTHELFTSLWINCEGFSTVKSLPAYLYASLRNRILNHITRQKIAARYVDSFRDYIETSGNSNTDHLLRHNDLLEFIEKEIAALSPKMRSVFELSRKTNLTRKEIAEELQISEETVKSHMHNALTLLKVKLGPMFFMLF